MTTQTRVLQTRPNTYGGFHTMHLYLQLVTWQTLLSKVAYKHKAEQWKVDIVAESLFIGCLTANTALAFILLSISLYGPCFLLFSDVVYWKAS